MSRSKGAIAVLFGALLLGVSLSHAQHDTLWLRTVTGTGEGDDQVKAVASDVQGNVYAAIRGKWDLKPCVTTVKYSSSGEMLWWRRLTRPNGVEPAGIAVDVAGNIFITGTTDTFGPQSNILALKYSGSGDSCWVAEYDATGQADIASAINLDASGNVYVSGSSIATAGTLDAVLVEYRNTGEFQWAQVFDRSQQRDSISSAVLDSSGCVYQVGYSGSEYLVLKYLLDGPLDWFRTYRTVGSYLLYGCALDPSHNLLACGSSRTRWDTSGIVAAKYDPAGARLWVQEIRGYDEGDWWNFATSVGSDALGNVFAAGSHCDGDSWGTSVVKYSPDGTVLWRRYCPLVAGGRWVPMAVNGSGETYVTALGDGVEKRNADGDTLWTRSWPSASPTPGTAIALTPDGVCVGGCVTVPDMSDITLKFRSDGYELWRQRLNNSPGKSGGWANDVAFDLWGNVIAAGGLRETGQYYEMATAKWSPSGDLQWARTYHEESGEWPDEADKVRVDGSGNVLVLGHTQTESTGYDYATLKYDPDGNLLWARNYNGPGNGDDMPEVIAVDRFGDVIVTGRSFGGSTGVDCATVKYSSDGQELWVRRYCGNGESLYNYGGALVADQDGDIFVAVCSEESAYHSPGVVVKYDAAGNQVWRTSFYVPGLTEYLAFVSIGLDSSGCIYLTGGAAYAPAPPHYHLVAAKMSVAGETTWVRSVPLDWVIARDGLVTPDGRLYATGIGSDTCLTLAYGPGGDLMWQAKVLDNLSTFAGRMAISEDNVLYVTSARHVDWNYFRRVIGYDVSGRACWGDSFPPDSASMSAVAAGPSNRIAVCGAISLPRGSGLYVALYEPRMSICESDRARLLAHLTAEPNPFRENTRLRVHAMSGTTISLRMYDRAGRLVRRLLERSTAHDAVTCFWDGTDDRGRPVGAGVYLAVLEAFPLSPGPASPSTRSAVKVVRLE